MKAKYQFISIAKDSAVAALAAVFAVSWSGAAIFGKDERRPVSDLQMKKFEELTDLEWAFLEATARAGFASCPNGYGTNGVLVRLRSGYDAVITSAHSFFKDGKPNCDLREVSYYPNIL